MQPFSIDILVAEAVRTFEKESGLSVSADASATLVARGKEHEEQIRADLQSGHATVPFLHGILVEVLRRAEVIAKSERRAAVEPGTLELALKEDCPYLGWC
jgi:hypothetical protein